MMHAEEGTTRIDLSLFNRIPSQTSVGDRQCLLALQQALRGRGAYVYLEIGSHLGGTIQPHYADPKCHRIYSIDKRPLSQPDERGEDYVYPENSTRKMRDNLAQAFPAMDTGRLVTFDTDAAVVEPAAIGEAPDFCFIDGEHTNAALVSDMRFCLKVIKPDGVICAHDAGVVSEGISVIKHELTARGVPFVGLKPGGSIYVFALGTHARRWEEILSDLLQDEAAYFKAAALQLLRQRREARLMRCPPCLHAYRTWTRILDWSYREIWRRITSGCSWTL